MSSNDSQTMRLQRFLAHARVSSRRRAEDLIAAHRVSVNGQVVTEQGIKVDPKLDVVMLDNSRLTLDTPKIYVFHKPRGVLTTMSDPGGRPSVGELFNTLPVRVFPVGRLDYDVSGLLLATNDGDTAERLLHPRYEVIRRYLACSCRQPDSSMVDRLTRGMSIDGVMLAAKEAKLYKDSDYVDWLFQFDSCRQQRKIFTLEIAVAEGSKHFVKKLCRGIEFPLLRLARVQFGGYHLRRLPVGEFCEVEFQDVK